MDKKQDQETVVISESGFNLGMKLAAVMVGFGILNSLGVVDFARNWLISRWRGPEVCEGVKNVSLPSASAYLEQEIGGWDCLSGMVDLPVNRKGAEFDVPGETRIYECQNDQVISCAYKFTIPNLSGGYYSEVPVFPDSFRMAGKPGVARFGKFGKLTASKLTASKFGRLAAKGSKKKKEREPWELSPESEKRIREIEKEVKKIKEMRRRNKID